MALRITVNSPSPKMLNENLAAESDAPAENAPVENRVPLAIEIEADDTPIIEIDNLTVAFGNTLVLDEISLNVARGEMLAIVGESGCGKTVLLKSMIGLIPPTAGHVLFDGQELSKLSHAALARQRQRFGFVFQMAALFDSMTIGENIAFPLEQHTHKTEDEVRAIAIRLLGEVGLPESALDKKPGELSGGMRKRVGFARALALAPEVMLFDEPTTGLDPVMSDIINDLIIATHERHKLTGIMVTHDMSSAMKVADRIIMLTPLARLTDEPQLIFSGTADDFMQCADPRVHNFLRGINAKRNKI